MTPRRRPTYGWPPMSRTPRLVVSCAFGLGVEAAERAAAAGERAMQASMLAEMVSVGTRFPAIFETDVHLERLQEILAVAERVAPDGDAAVEAQVAAVRTTRS
jgi:hypothetical protein